MEDIGKGWERCKPLSFPGSILMQQTLEIEVSGEKKVCFPRNFKVWHVTNRVLVIATGGKGKEKQLG